MISAESGDLPQLWYPVISSSSLSGEVVSKTKLRRPWIMDKTGASSFISIQSPTKINPKNIVLFITEQKNLKKHFA